MVEEKKHKSLVKDVAFRVVKAAFRASLLYIIYFLLVPFLAPLFLLVPALAGTIRGVCDGLYRVDAFG